MASFTNIETRIHFLTGTDINSFPNADLNHAVGEGTKRVSTLINRYRTGWQYDDENYTDLPIDEADLVSGQQDYNLKTEHITVDRVDILSENGDALNLTQIDQQLLKRDRKVALDNYKSTDGTPDEYDIMGNSIFLYPAPNYAKTKGLIVYFTRPPLLFDYTDDTFSTAQNPQLASAQGSSTSVPGFNQLFHDLIPLWASFDYLQFRKPEKAQSILIRIQTMERELEESYGLRNRDERQRISVTTDSNK